MNEELTKFGVFRDAEDLAVLLAVPGNKVDLARVRPWAERLYQSIGTDDVSTRLARALATARRRR